MMRFLPPRAEFHTPLGVSLFSLVGTVVLAVVSALLTAFAVYLVFLKQWGWSTFAVTAAACFVAALTGYVGRDLHGKWRLRIFLDYDGVKLDLPSGRSLIHRPPEQHLKVPYADIEAVETRLEAYRTFGMAMMQRAYVLRPKSSELIFLFEDRALGTSFESHMFPKLAADIAARAHAPLRDLGMVEGSGGMLGVWGTHSPDWATPSLPLALQLRLWRHAAATGSLAFSAVILAFMIRAMF
jgi:hypothetical protein